MTFQHRVTLSLDPVLEAKLDRLLAFLESLDQGMTDDEAAAVTAHLKQQAAKLEGIAAEPKS